MGDLRTIKDFFGSPPLLALMEAPVSLVFLALLGGIAARAGGAGIVTGAGRVLFWGAIAMGATRYGAGRGRRGLRGSEPSVCNGMENPAAWVWPPPPNDAAIEPTSVPSSRERML